MTPSEPLDRAALWARTVDTLTQAVRLTRPGPDGATEPDDFADFLSSALLAVAANVGSVHRLTAGRPGSWEATSSTNSPTATSPTTTPTSSSPTAPNPSGSRSTSPSWSTTKAPTPSPRSCPSTKRARPLPGPMTTPT